MFEGILEKHFGWGKSTKEPVEAAPATRVYQHLFAGAAAPSSSLLMGMTTLWATEKCYLEAWRYAKRQQADSGSDGEDNVIQSTLIPNWTSPEFEAFVDQLSGLVDELAEGQSVTEGDRDKCEQIWRHVLWAEKEFWPSV